MDRADRLQGRRSRQAPVSESPPPEAATDGAPISRRGFLARSGQLVALSAGPVLAALIAPCARERPLVTHRFHALGTRVTLLINHPDRALARSAARAATRALFAVHECMTLFEPSPLGLLNQHGFAGPVRVPAPLAELLAQSLELNARTRGLFDITAGKLARLAPTAGPAELAAAREGAGPERVSLDGLSARLAHPLTEVDLNGIAKGYAVDRAAAALRRAGVCDFLVNAGGDLYAAGRPPLDEAWRVQVAHPRGAAPLLELSVRDRAVATSGNYLQPPRNGAPFTHLVDPRRGEPTDPLASATVTADTAVAADAWATAAFVGGADTAAELIAAQSSLQAVLVTRELGVLRLG